MAGSQSQLPIPLSSENQELARAALVLAWQRMHAPSEDENGLPEEVRVFRSLVVRVLSSGRKEREWHSNLFGAANHQTHVLDCGGAGKLGLTVTFRRVRGRNIPAGSHSVTHALNIMSGAPPLVMLYRARERNIFSKKGALIDLPDRPFDFEREARGLSPRALREFQEKLVLVPTPALP